MGPFTGPSESTGNEFEYAVTMAFDAIDWQIGDYQVEVVWIDSQSDPDAATGAYETAIVEEGMQAAILNWHSRWPSNAWMWQPRIRFLTSSRTEGPKQ